jgi:hypothetical protein
MYNDLVLKLETSVNCWTWKAKISLKIKIFFWYLKNGVVLTKDNLEQLQQFGKPTWHSYNFGKTRKIGLQQFGKPTWQK